MGLSKKQLKKGAKLAIQHYKEQIVNIKIMIDSDNKEFDLNGTVYTLNQIKEGLRECETALDGWQKFIKGGCKVT